MRTFASPEKSFLIVSIVIGVTGLVLGAIHLSFHGTTGQKVRKGAGVAMLLAGIFGAWTWKLTPKQHLPYMHDERAAYELAIQQHKGVMVDFAASWCMPCQEMELTFGDDDVYDAILAGFVPLQLDVSDDNAANAAIRKRYGAGTLPTVVFMGNEGTPLHTIVQLTEPDEMLEIVGPATKKAVAIAHSLPWVSDEKQAFDQARAQNKGVLVAFDATWCGPCKEPHRCLRRHRGEPREPRALRGEDAARGRVLAQRRHRAQANRSPDACAGAAANRPTSRGGRPQLM
jgi:thiol:disulfide interchange protein